jgi:hypothetical protein
MPESDWTRLGRWLGPAVVAGVGASTIAVAAGLLASEGRNLGLPAEVTASRLAVGVLSVELVLCAVLTPFLAVGFRRGARWGECALQVATPLLALAAVSVAACTMGAGDASLRAAAAWAQLFLLAFAALLAAATLLLMSLRASRTAAQWVAMGLALAMAANVFYVNAVLGPLGSPAAKTAVARVALWTNPWLIVTGSLLQADPLRTQRLYEWCVIGDYQYPVSYPAAGMATTAGRTLAVTAAYLAIAGVLALLAWSLRRARRGPSAGAGTGTRPYALRRARRGPSALRCG